MVATALDGKIPEQCYGEWAEDDISKEPYGPKSEWKIGTGISVLAVSTLFHTYSSTDEAFSVVMPYDLERTDVMNNITYLMNNSWIDQATRVVIIDVLTFNPSIDAFALNHFFVEFFATGSTVAGSKAYPFDLLRFDTTQRRFLFVADIALAVGTGVLILALFFGIYQRIQLGIPWWMVQPFELFDVGFIVFLVYTVIYRMKLWSEGPDLHDGTTEVSELNMYQSLFEYGFHFERANTYVGIAVVFAWLRLFKFLQYNNRLGVLSETARRAASDLMAMFLIFFIVLVGYGIGGSALYGVDHKSFSSWWLAMSYLLRLLISAEVDQHYDELKRIHPDWTGLYMASFIIITWVILLNMVLAIITGAFVASQENMKVENEGFSFDGLKKDSKNLMRRMLPCLNNRSKSYCEARVNIIRWVIRHVEDRRIPGVRRSKEVRLTLEEWCKGTAMFLHPEQCIRLFERAHKKGDVERNYLKVGQRFASGVNVQLAALQESVRGIQQGATTTQTDPPSPPTRNASQPPDMMSVSQRRPKTRVKPAPESSEKDAKMERRKRREEDLRTAAASVLSESTLVPLAPASPASVPWGRVGENHSFRITTDTESSQDSGGPRCALPGCDRSADLDLNDVVQEYCELHLCHGCYSVKRPSQSVCTSCEADVSGHMPGPKRAKSTPMLCRSDSTRLRPIHSGAQQHPLPMTPQGRRTSSLSNNPLNSQHM